MFELKKVGKLDIRKLFSVADILNACGKDMAVKYDLHHWDNSYFKSLAIVGICDLKNDIYLLFDEKKPVATFMTRIIKDALHFEKLGTLPSESNRGIGTLCMEKIEGIAKKLGCKKVIMEVYEPSRHAIEFYEHRGYKVWGKTETLKYTEIKMEKNI